MGRFCTNCWKPLKEGAKFCGNCGEAVEAKAVERPKVMARRPYRPAEQRLQSEAGRHELVQQPQSSSGGFWHFLAGTALGGFLGNLFGSSASAHSETVINHNETIINEYEDDDEGLMEERLGNGLEYDEDDSYDVDYDDQEDYGEDGKDRYYDGCDDDDDDYDDSCDSDGDGDFFDDFAGGDDFGGDNF